MCVGAVAGIKIVLIVLISTVCLFNYYEINKNRVSFILLRSVGSTGLR